MKVFGYLSLLVMLLAWMFSCKVQPPVALPYGQVISIDCDLVEVVHEVINKQRGSQIAAWYYVPGHRFVKGDIFPDFTRYINPTPSSVPIRRNGSPPTPTFNPDIQ